MHGVKIVVIVLALLGMTASLYGVDWRTYMKAGGEAAEDYFGWPVSGAGDVNGDGYDDVIVGASDHDFDGMGDAGAAYIFFGGPSMNSIPDVKMGGKSDSAYFGWSVSGAGDVNGDGYDDVIVGAPWYNSDTGATYIFFGGSPMDSIPDVEIVYPDAGAGFGFSVSGAGDVNGDGYDDVIVGAPYYDGDAGAAYIFLGGSPMDSIPDVEIVCPDAGAEFGTSVSGAGDVNHDGYDDVIVGAPYYDGGAGAAYLFFGGSPMDSIPDDWWDGEAGGDEFGWSVSGAGDVNGDGYDDVIVGADCHNFDGMDDAGVAYILLGGAGYFVDFVKMGGEWGEDYFGWSVSGAGDVNHDGYDDVIVGAPCYDFVYMYDVGATYIFYGGSPMDSIPDVKMGGEWDEDYFGDAVSGAGDVNGDGYDDVIVGADCYDFGGMGDAGAAYIYDFFQYILCSPTGGETWNVGAMKTIKWIGYDIADIWLSVDGGASWDIHLATCVGGEKDTNRYSFRVPHVPTRFAMIKVAKYNDARFYAVSDSFFTISSTITTKSFFASYGDGGVNLSWETEPGVPEIAGYNIYRADNPDADFEKINHEIIIETSYLDNNPCIGTLYYKLGAVNGWGREYIVASTATVSFDKPLVVFPSPFVSGNLTIGYWVPQMIFGTRDIPVILRIYSIDGGRVATLMSEQKETGFYFTKWDGKDSSGKNVRGGIYFLRLEAGNSYSKSVKFVIMR